MSSIKSEWLWGWDPTPGIVSVHADLYGRATVWRRDPATGTLVTEQARFRPWLLLDRLDDLLHVGSALGTEDDPRARFRHRELEGAGTLRHLVTADNGRTLTGVLLHGASRRLGKRIGNLADLPDDSVLSLPPEEQYLVATGRTYFRDLPFDALRRLQFDLETTGLDARQDRVFMISVRHHDGATEVLEADAEGDAGEAGLIRRLMERVQAADPDVIENHNLHGFDLPFLDRRARLLGVRLVLGRVDGMGLRTRGARRGVPSYEGDDRRVRFVAPGRELIDTLDFVRRHDLGRRDLPGHGLKAVARHLGIAAPDREYIPGAEIHSTYRVDPERVRRYATDDVVEVAALSRMLGGATYALAQMVPRRYERLADAGPATGMIDPILVRAYLRAGQALPGRAHGDGTPHSGAALHLFATGVAHRVVKADVASLYPSLMRSYRIGPASDRLGALLALVDDLVARRLDAKARSRAAAASAERHAHDAMAAALKIVVNSAYGYLATGGGLVRFADVHAANEVTRHGREVLALLCRELAARGVTLIEADTDGVYFAVPPAWREEDERRVVSEVGGLLPPLVQLELEGRYRAMLSHEPKNYVLLDYDGVLHLTGVAFRSSRSEPFAERFLRQAVGRLLVGDIHGVRETYVSTVARLRARALPTRDVSSLARLTKTPAEYLGTRATRREMAYEALLGAGQATWRAGDRVRVYRKRGGEAGIVLSSDEDLPADDPRDYDGEWYVRLLKSTYAERLARAFTAEDFARVFADAEQLDLLAPGVEGIRPVLHTVAAASGHAAVKGEHHG